VAPEKTQREINELLRECGVSQVAWFDDRQKRQIGLQFVMPGLGGPRLVRKVINERPLKYIEAQARRKRGRLDASRTRLLEQARRQAYRVLWYWLRATFTLIHYQDKDIDEVLHPWYVLPGGSTIGEQVLGQTRERLDGWLRGKEVRLLAGVEEVERSEES